MTRRLDELLHSINNGWFNMGNWDNCVAAHCRRMLDVHTASETVMIECVKNVLDLKHTDSEELHFLVYDNYCIGVDKEKAARVLREMCYEDDMRGKVHALKNTKAEADDGSSSTQSAVREEGWYPSEGSEGFQPSRQEEVRELEDA